jgi:hypothetical protein
MLLRDLKLKPREKERYFDDCRLRLADGSRLHIQLALRSITSPKNTALTPRSNNARL